MNQKIVDCFFIVEKAMPLKPAPPQPVGSQGVSSTTAADLLSRKWEGKITYMNPVLSGDDLSPSAWIVKKNFSSQHICRTHKLIHQHCHTKNL